MTGPTRRRLGAGLAAAALARPALAQGWPSRPIRMVVPYPPVGGADTTARLLDAAAPGTIPYQFTADRLRPLP